jgi:hypothetical protein
MPRYSSNRIVSSLATQQAAIAVVAMHCIFHEAQHRPSRSDSQQCAQRADGPAPEPSNPEVQCKDEQEYESKPNTLPKVWLLEIQEDCPKHKVECAADGLHKGKATMLK